MNTAPSLSNALSNKGSSKGAIHGDSQLARILADMCRQGVACPCILTAVLSMGSNASMAVYACPCDQPCMPGPGIGQYPGMSHNTVFMRRLLSVWVVVERVSQLAVLPV